MTASTRATAAPVIPLEKLEELWEIFCPNEQGYSAAMNFARAVEAESLKLQPIQQHSGNPASTGREPLDVEFKQLADTILQATTNGARLEALRGMAALFDSLAAPVAAADRVAARTAATSTQAERAPGEAEEAPELPPLYAQALDLVHKAGYASVSMVQRRMRIGWNAARDLIVLMHDRSEIPDAWLPPAAAIGMKSPHSPLGAKEQDK